jgi:hypothetical protein
VKVPPGAAAGPSRKAPMNRHLFTRKPLPDSMQRAPPNSSLRARPLKGRHAVAALSHLLAHWSVPLFALFIVGCVTEPSLKSAQRCSLVNAEDWSLLAKAPPQKAGLLGQIKKEPWYQQSVLSRPGGQSRWFSAGDGTRLAYCYLPEFPSSCNNYTVAFTWKDGSWQQTEDQAEAAVCGY